MARQFLTGLNLNKNELLNARIQNLASAPDAPVAGQIYYNTGDNTLRYYNGTSWLTLAQGGSVGDAITAAINLLTTSDIEEGTNLYYTEERAKTDAAELLTGATLTNITITGDGDGLTITAENGVADSTTDDLDEGTTNRYFTDQRALDATASAYDAAGAAATVQDNLDDHTEASSGVHGLDAGVNVVGDTASQTLTNKTLGTGTVLSANVDADQNKIVDLAEPTSAQDAATKNYVDTELADHADDVSGVHGVTGNVVGTTDTQTLTNKTLGAGNSLSEDLDADGNKITNVGTPTADTDAANKAYVDSVATGLDVKASVKAATTQDEDLSTYPVAGDLMDGVTLAAGDRVLIKNQTDASLNGIYVVDAEAAPTRAIDADGTSELTAGTFVFVEQGGTNADSGWVISTDGAITVGTTDIEWVQFSGAGQVVAGSGLTKAGNTLDVVGTADRITVNADSIDIASTYAGQTSITTVGTIATGTWEATDVAVAHGGTGASTAANARANLGATTKYTAANPELLSSSGAITWVVTHNLEIRTVVVQVYELETFDEVEVDVERTNTNEVTLRWVSAATVDADSYQVVIIG
jgi:hypothetical protein